MPSSSEPICQEMVAICRLLYQHGFIVGTEGNVSVRVASDRLWITPTGCHKGLLSCDDLVLIDLEGRVLVGQRQPSSEVLMHLALYRCRPDIRAVVHAHPPMATALTLAGYVLEPALLPESVVLLGEVPTVPYRMPATPQFAREIGEAMRRTEAVLLEHHGSVTIGSSLLDAFNRMEVVERVAQVFYLAQTLGRVRHLSSADVAALQSLRQVQEPHDVFPKE